MKRTHQVRDEHLRPVLQRHVRVRHARGERYQARAPREMERIWCRGDDEAVASVVLSAAIEIVK